MMNTLMIVSIALLVLFTVIGIKVIVDDRRSWKEIEAKASDSNIKGFN
ncbi:hypothetical protein [Alkalimarinus alittae]|uniref:Uncharacterized protein n=1 Tax=Alkalimarinus alittae TaxID=2961619 RepID=A0ABY6N570_9ALTE|nr:hypothetical protein [Alkalimarinus alittae]UZE97271.1 hypothetical protein NKI27_05840 [Alkalimarinus alittae]